MTIFHLIEPATWASVREGERYAPPSLDTEGFVHFSYAAQLAGTANLFYRDLPELLALEIDPAALSAELRVEDTYGSGTAFPHVYGPVELAAVVAVHPLRRDASGDWVFSPADPAAGASTDR